MNRGTLVTLAVALGTVLPLSGQTRSEPQILLSIFGGMAGGSDLWSVGRQPLLVLVPPGSLLPPVHDTLRLSRMLRPGIVAGFNATYFPSPHLGVLGEISFLGLGLEDRCTLIAENVSADPQRRNQQVCNDINGRSSAANAVAFFVGALARTSPAAVVPYLRVQAGFTTRQSSLTDVSGRFLDPATGAPVSRGIFIDQGGGRVDPAASVGLGMMAHVSSGYQFRVELRDHFIRTREVTGPTEVGSPGRPPVTSQFIHNFALLIHLDIVLERRRGRRY